MYTWELEAVFSKSGFEACLELHLIIRSGVDLIVDSLEDIFKAVLVLVESFPHFYEPYSQLIDGEPANFLQFWMDVCC